MNEPRCDGCPHRPHYGECPSHVIDLTHAPVDRLCWCNVRVSEEAKPAPAIDPVAAPV